MIADAIDKYPAECCGFLLGKEDNQQRIISRIITCRNNALSKEKEFFIAAEDYKNAETKAEAKGLHLLGIYHSHPNSEAVPSATDRQHALPYFSYVIISVFKHQISALKSWRMSDASRFEEEKIITNQNSISKINTAYGNHHYSHPAS